MASVTIKLKDLEKVIIPLGYVGENLHRTIFIDCEEAFSEYPTAVPGMSVSPPKGNKYPATIIRNGNIVKWVIKNSDLIYKGNGEIQLNFVVDEVVSKSCKGKFVVKDSIIPDGDAPDPFEDWLVEAEAVLGDLEGLDDIVKSADASDEGKALSPKTVENGIVTEWQYVSTGGGGTGGTTNYNDLDNKPKIAGTTLSGNKSLSDLGIASATDLSAKYSKPSGGIPSTDMTSDVQGSLSKAESAYQKPSGGIPATDIASGVIPSVTGKADKVSSATNGNFAALDSNGNLTDSGHKHSDYLTSHQDISGKADKVASATNGNFASLDSNGNLVDSGHKHGDYLTSHQDISGKLDKSDFYASEMPISSSDSTKVSADLANVKSALGSKIDEPSSDGTDGQVLATDGDGGRYWKTVSGGGGGTSDYTDLTNKPQINSVTLSGNKSLSDLGIASATDLSAKYTKPSGGIPSTDIASGVIPDVTGKADKVTSATSGNFAGLDSNGNLTDSGKKASDFLTSHQDISGKVNGASSSVNNDVVIFDGTTGKTIKDSGFTIGKSVPSDAVFTDTTYESKSASSGGTAVSLVTTGEKYTWNNKGSYSKPSGGIPSTDMTSAVQTSLGLADSAYQKPSGGIPATDLASGVIPTVHNVPDGGSTDQVLAKNSGTDYDLKWVTLSGGGGTVDDELSTSSTNPVQNKVITAEINNLNDAVFTEGEEEITAPDLFLTVTDTDLMLSIDDTSFSTSSAQSGFYVDVSEYRGKEILIKRTENGAVLRGVFTHDIPAVGVTFSSANTWNKGLTGRCVIIDVPDDSTINYVYIAYHSTNLDSITKQQALAGMTIFQPDEENQYDRASSDMMLSFSSGTFTQASSLYGFYVPVDNPSVQNILISRTNTGSRFRCAFSTDVPAVGKTYTGYTNDAYDAQKQIYLSVPSGAKYLYVAYYRTADSLTKEQLLAGMDIRYCVPAEITVASGEQSKIEILHDEIYDKGTGNLYDSRSERMLLGMDSTKFVSSETLCGFYVPIDPDKGTTVTIRRKNAGQRFRVVSCTDIPAVNVTYTSGKQVQLDTAKVIVYDKIVSTDRYLYVAYYSTSVDTLTESELLVGMTIVYGTDQDYAPEESRIERLDYLWTVGFVNGNINSSGKLVESSKHIVSSAVRVNGRYGISAPSTYTVAVHEFDFEGNYIFSYSVTNATQYAYHWGNIKVCISKNDSSDITPATVDFSAIKIPFNRFSAKAFADSETFVLDAENCTTADVYAYIDDIAESHSSYVTKTKLCDDSSGLPVYYYTLGSGAKKVCIVSGQHGPGSGGDPRDSVITVAKIMHDLIDGNFAQGSFLQTLHDDYTLLVMPVFNPYGFDNFTRTDADDVDTNRDWTSADTAQVAAAQTVMVSFDPDLALDVHCNGTTPTSDANLNAPQYGFGSTLNTSFGNAVSSYFTSYYNVTLESRLPNTDDTLQVYIRDTLGALGGLLELRWWMKDRKWMHDYQAESCDYAMVINSLKYLASVNDSETFVFEKTPNQNQY